ncbi:thiol-disulfide oxidoreductase [Maioricimonas rarisocia]|uniref:Thiol-disulfide oxidoreductase n=1 Tax=Maioricimonas rarisocia TaxID=2528026 RepID=A0A517Z4D2_9PLAN|nr:redoxin domain-containing protein [Maioricimonas rarisocia]QDU37329.1 thiol-disulfide oxidoreductase [Maioricimonas rarisocia]
MRAVLQGVVLKSVVALGMCSAAFAADSIREAPRRLKPAEVGVGTLVSDFTATDFRGEPVSLSAIRGERGTLIALTSTSCPLCQKYVPTLARIEESCRERGIGVVFLNPIASDRSEKIGAAIETHGLEGPYIHDQDETLARSLGALTTTEVFLLDAAGTLVYRGAIDDQYGFGYALNEPRESYLEAAIDALLAGRRPEVAATTAPGCELWSPESVAEARSDIPVTWHERVSRIVQQNCQECHRDGGLGPFPLETADEVIAHAGMIRRVVSRGLMPPWFAGPVEGQEPGHWANDRSLSERDREDLLAWLEGDRALGDPENGPLPLSFTDEWQIGEPDLVVQIPKPMAIQATGQMPYQHATIETTFDEEKWVQAVEIRPTNRAVVHHVLVFVRMPGAEKVRNRDGFFAAYVPGNDHQIYPDGLARRLPAGASLVFQLHYTPIGTAAEDQTRLALRFAEEPPTHLIRTTGIYNGKIAIPPGASNHAETASITVPSDVKLLGFMPHMHLRGKAFRYDLIKRDDSRRTLLDVPAYDFNWQLEYRLSEPLDVDRGSKLEVTGWYDNSAENPANPDPTITVEWGDQTDDEMLIGYIEYYVPGEPIAAEDDPADGDDPVSQRFRRVDRNGDGQVSREELPLERVFARLDLDTDGFITLEEARQGLRRR